ncbi:CRISPR-associated nuclease/helicase Cas3 [Clostridium tepidiprofundi DSM 19306]|uniref:CRISPR-associated nuclease/helicase Cas3 n=1 Tax=Clostridium tepidiprofundi DSM 19306 TaxID=1121338 RepID=A0A151B2F2_9CLOT|nr:CRISPR-associated helicase/endonuclease Cas3 [Clostridium tepidiprofundi]KYH34084.1 CRISPR-associated nuclease/helicase Cas3 [Clostridium tepidiprofundi DSM 19306]
MKNKFLAKTHPRETIAEHTQCLIDRMEVLKELYPNIPYLDWELLRLACLYHDLGKMNSKFQNKLLKKLGEGAIEDDLKGFKEIPHGYLSPAFLPLKKLKRKYKSNKDKLKVLYQSIYYHHNREKIHDFTLIENVIEKDLKKHWEYFDGLEVDKDEKLYKSYLKYVDEKNRFARSDDKNNDSYYEYVITKGILNRLDYAGSAHINVEEENKDLYEKTIYSVESRGFKLNELQEYMKNNLEENNIIRASTGIGKTEAALIWIGNNKGFFTLPLRVSINAIYDRVRDKKKIGFENTALLHSDTFREYLKRGNSEDKGDDNQIIDMDYYEKTKQFSMPLTICTLDQLLDFVFKYEGYELKLATLAYSKLVIDEIQMYSPDMLGYLIAALKYISEAGGKFSILTATLPNIILDFMRKENIPFKEPKTFYKKNSKGEPQLRHKIEVIEDYINIDHIKDNYKDKKVLVIVNTVKQAQKIYDDLMKAELNIPINMFHSRFIKKDRSLKENLIFEMGQRECSNKGIWVTTQVVEASLDIDFDVLYTELSEISGLLQRMGRIYRGRDLDSDNPNIYIYIGKDKPTSGIRNDDRSIVDIDIFKYSKEAVKSINGEKLDEEKKMQFVEMVYTEKNLKDSAYYKKMKEALLWTKNIKEYELQKNEARLRNITTYLIIPKCVYDSEEENEIINSSLSKISKYRAQMKEEKDKKKLQDLYVNIQKEKYNIKDYTVDIPGYMFETAKRNNKVYDVIELDKFNNIPIVKIDYTYEKGLGKVNTESVFDEDFQFI